MYIYSICIKQLKKLKKLYNKLLKGNFKNKNYLIISCINTILNHNSLFFFTSKVLVPDCSCESCTFEGLPEQSNQQVE